MMKKTLIWIGTVIGTAAVLALVFGALERRSNPETVAVRGECNTTAPKDKTAITLRITTLAPTAAESMRAATTQVADITQFLESQPVEVQTTQFNSYEKTEWNRDEQKSVVLGIETNIAIEVSANSVDIIENILGRFSGAQNVFAENLRMYTSPSALQPVLDRCLGIAVENARVRATALAAGDNRRVGKMLSVAYGTQTSDVMHTTSSGLLRNAKATIESAAAFDAGGTIVARDTDVAVSVSAIFEIK